MRQDDEGTGELIRMILSQRATAQLDAIDRRIVAFMDRWGIRALRISLALIFIWFGALKPLGISPAGPLVKLTVQWMPFLSPDAWVVVIGWWEVAIGVTFLFHGTVRVAIALLAVQMVGTLLPLIILPHVTFQSGYIPYAPTIEGQYIIKNLLIISAALVVGSTARHAAPGTGRPGGSADARQEVLPVKGKGRLLGRRNEGGRASH